MQGKGKKKKEKEKRRRLPGRGEVVIAVEKVVHGGQRWQCR
jgi:hypothetical protein